MAKQAWLVCNDSQPDFIALTRKAAVARLVKEGFKLDKESLCKHIYTKPYPPPHDNTLMEMNIQSVELIDG